MNGIENLQNLMKSRGIDAYIIPTEDFHGSEYVGAHFKLREYLSGFTGSAGTLLVTLDGAYLWTDGRYFLQAARELDGSGITLMRSGEPDVPEITKFLQDFLTENSVLGFDGRVLSADFALRLQKSLPTVTLMSDEDLGDLVWENRPQLSAQPVYELPEHVCGLSRAEKLAQIRAKIAERKADFLVTSALDEIAWSLNLRGSDVDFNPVFLAFMIVGQGSARIFAEPRIFSPEIRAELDADGIEVLPYNMFYSVCSELSGAVIADLKSLNFAAYSAMRNAKICRFPSPIMQMKAVKNSTEILAERSAHIKDGIAVTRFMRWLKTAVQSEKITEISAAEKLEEFRKMGADYLGQSFEPIMAYGEHGAIVHYSATSATNAVIEPRGLLLSDTGGHYFDGTTDITRTFALGALSDEEKRAFTLVLAAHLELLHARFPKGVRGSTLDGIARLPLWREGLDFNHGTGHGVGFLLNVHEGPQRVSWRAVNDVPLEAGMITSDEPGLYVANRFGIRHESLVLCKKSAFEGFLEFEPLTCVPFDHDGIAGSLLSDLQKSWFNEYQKWVFDTLSPHLNPDEIKWLSEVTKPI